MTDKDIEELLTYCDQFTPAIMLDGKSVYPRIAEGLRELRALLVRERWIPVGEKMPEPKQQVMLLVSGEVHIGFWFGDSEVDAWCLFGGGSRARGDITHWRLLPPVPSIDPPAKEEACNP